MSKRIILSTVIGSLLAFSLMAEANTNTNTNLTGAGASFPAPVYAKWADTYYQQTQVKVNYQSIGSSGGIKQINAKTVDFGASDMPLSDQQLQQQGLFQFPTVIGGIVIVVNINGIGSGELLLDGTTIGDIFLGKIKRWNDPAITKLNPTLSLPNLPINVVRRADGSGTTYVFSQYLSKTNTIWRDEIGIGSAVKWPVGIGGKGNDGVAAFVQRLPGSIGFVEYAYAKQNKLAYSRLYSADNTIVEPSEDSFSAAALHAKWNESFAQDLTQQPGANAWPITSATFILLQRTQDNDKGRATLDFFDWAYQYGKQQAIALDYAVLPDSVISQIKQAWSTQITDKQGATIYHEK